MSQCKEYQSLKIKFDATNNFLHAYLKLRQVLINVLTTSNISSVTDRQ